MKTQLGKEKITKVKNLILAGDIGGTKTNLTLFKLDSDHFVPLKEAQYITANYSNLIEILSLFMENLPEPDTICFGVAGPVIKGHAKFSNLKWEIDSEELSEHFKKRSGS